jgi:DNA-binding NarL/FixJ family response regulator
MAARKSFFLTIESNPDFVREGLAAGAFGYVAKHRVTSNLTPAIQSVLAGDFFFSPMK